MPSPTVTSDREALRALILARRSIRRFLPEPVPRDVIRRLLEAAGRAPSAHNRQPWRWVVIEQEARRRALAEDMGRDFARDLAADGLPPERIEQMVARSHARIGGAPLLILPCLTMTEMDRYPDPTRRLREWQMAVQSVALAAGNLLLAAHAEGLGGCWICAPIFCVPTVQQSLALPPDWEPQALLALGTPADRGRDREKKEIDEVTLWR